VQGGLASQVAESLFDHGVQKTLIRIGLPDRFIECGAVPTLQKRYGLDTAHLIAAGLGLPAQVGRRSV
jgi:transketolase